jgi:membrane-associated phospholipid phosphatase
VARRWWIAALGTIFGALLLLGDLTDDVSEHNGQTLHDASRLDFFTDHRPHLLVSAAKVVTDLGAVSVLAVLAIAISVLLWRRRIPLVLALAPLVALAVSATCVAIMKSVIGRARPPVGLHLVSERDASFPSGHATDSTALFLTVGIVLAAFVLRRPLARVLVVAGAALLVGAIGVTRLVLGVHWPTDVIAGWSLGFAIALAVTLFSAVLLGSTGWRRPALRGSP